MFFLPGGEVILFRVNSLKLKGLQFNIRYFISGYIDDSCVGVPAGVDIKVDSSTSPLTRCLPPLL